MGVGCFKFSWLAMMSERVVATFHAMEVDEGFAPPDSGMESSDQARALRWLLVLSWDNPGSTLLALLQGSLTGATGSLVLQVEPRIPSNGCHQNQKA